MSSPQIPVIIDFDSWGKRQISSKDGREYTHTVLSDVKRRLPLITAIEKWDSLGGLI